MRILASLLLLPLLGGPVASIPAEIYKCKEANGSILYTDSPCDPDADTMAVMPQGASRFQPPAQWDPLAEDDLPTLAAQEQALLEQLKNTRFEPEQSLREKMEVYALRRQLFSLLKSVRRQKADVQRLGIAADEGEELLPDPDR